MTDVDTLDLEQGDEIRLCITGKPGALYMMFLSFGGGPINTPWGVMGLSFPMISLWSANLNAYGYQTIDIEIQSDPGGTVEFYTHALVDDDPPAWAIGGNNPNGSGSIKWRLHETLDQ